MMLFNPHALHSKTLKTPLNRCLMAALLALAGPVSAGNGSDEKALIIKSAGELEYVRGLLAQAKKADNGKGGLKLDYSALEADLATIQAALERHASTPQRTPKRIPGLSGGYITK
jgi:hypothetical protein